MLHKSSAWPLALVYTALIVYASLYPFADWRDQGLWPWSFLAAPWPRYWTSFDVVANALGYGPLGFLLALGVLRSQGAGRVPAWRAVVLALVLALVLSLLLETVQSYLPVRVPSRLDWLLNAGGALAGALLAALLERLGAMDRWSRFRARGFAPDARGALVLLCLWPAALLFPASVPLGLGQVLERLEQGLAELLADTPFLELLPVREIELQPMWPGTELLCVMLGVLVPLLLGYGVIRGGWRRLAFLLLTLAVGAAATALSAGLTYGPSHAWAWLSLPVRYGLLGGGALGLLLLWLPPRACMAFLLLALAVQLGLLNQAPEGAYFAQTLQTWEQGRFIRFHGLAQWLGWLWPYAALLYVLARLSSIQPLNSRA